MSESWPAPPSDTNTDQVFETRAKLTLSDTKAIREEPCLRPPPAKPVFRRASVGVVSAGVFPSASNNALTLPARLNFSCSDVSFDDNTVDVRLLVTSSTSILMNSCSLYYFHSMLHYVSFTWAFKAVHPRSMYLQVLIVHAGGLYTWIH